MLPSPPAAALAARIFDPQLIANVGHGLVRYAAPGRNELVGLALDTGTWKATSIACRSSAGRGRSPYGRSPRRHRLGRDQVRRGRSGRARAGDRSVGRPRPGASRRPSGARPAGRGRPSTVGTLRQPHRAWRKRQRFLRPTGPEPAAIGRPRYPLWRPLAPRGVLGVPLACSHRCSRRKGRRPVVRSVADSPRLHRSRRWRRRAFVLMFGGHARRRERLRSRRSRGTSSIFAMMVSQTLVCARPERNEPCGRRRPMPGAAVAHA